MIMMIMIIIIIIVLPSLPGDEGPPMSRHRPAASSRPHPNTRTRGTNMHRKPTNRKTKLQARNADSEHQYAGKSLIREIP